jgi:hypothetical protein
MAVAMSLRAAARRLSEEDQVFSESPMIVAFIIFLSVIVCIFYVYLIKVGALADCVLSWRRCCGKKVAIRPLPPPPKVKKKKKIIAEPIKAVATEQKIKKKFNLKTGHEVGRAWDIKRYDLDDYDAKIAEVGKSYMNGEGARGEQASGSGAGV